MTGTEVECAPASQKKPAMQGSVGSSSPADAQNCPGGQSTHSASLPRCVALLDVPEGHGCGEVVPSGQKCPGVQAAGCTVRKASHEKRSVHGWHSACAGASVNVPGTHGFSATDPAGQKVPGWQVWFELAREASPPGQ